MARLAGRPLFIYHSKVLGHDVIGMNGHKETIDELNNISYYNSIDRVTIKIRKEIDKFLKWKKDPRFK